MEPGITVLFHEKSDYLFSFEAIKVGDFHFIDKSGEGHILLLTLQIKIEQRLKELFRFSVSEVALGLLVESVEELNKQVLRLFVDPTGLLLQPLLELVEHVG